MSKHFASGTMILLSITAYPAIAGTIGLSTGKPAEFSFLISPHKDNTQTNNKNIQILSCNTAQARDCQSQLNDCLEECISGEPDPKCQKECQDGYGACKVHAGCKDY